MQGIVGPVIEIYRAIQLHFVLGRQFNAVELLYFVSQAVAELTVTFLTPQEKTVV